MHRIDRLNGSGGARLAAALLLCVLFFLLTVSLVRVGFESNDDLTLAAFVDGQMAHPTAHIPYINIALGALLKGIYDLLGRGAAPAWHSLSYNHPEPLQICRMRDLKIHRISLDHTDLHPRHMRDLRRPAHRR